MKSKSVYIVLLVLVANLSQNFVAVVSQNDPLKCSMVQIHYLKDDQNTIDINCLAVIISATWLLSPASCLFDFSNPQKYIVSFANNQTFNVKKIIVNDNYNNELGAGYDIAMINVDREIGGGICKGNLMDINTKSFKDDCKLIKRDHNSKSLVADNIEMDLNNECNNYFGKDLVVPHLTVCAGGEKAGVCIGETGAILACLSTDSNSAYYLRGIASWGEQNCKKHPYVFTNINYSPYLQWIRNTAALN